MNANFDEALGYILQQEGEYSNHPRDPGGETFGGLSSKWNPDAEMLAMSARATRDRYKRNYWDSINADMLPPGMDIFAFDMSVNLGPTKTREILRKANTLEELHAERIRRYDELVRDNPKMLTFYNGWLKRADEMMSAARRYEAASHGRFVQHMQVIGKEPLPTETEFQDQKVEPIEDTRYRAMQKMKLNVPIRH